MTNVLEHLGQQLGSPASWAHRELRNPLASLAFTPVLATSLAVSLEVQSLCDGLLLGGAGGHAPLAGAVVLYQNMMLWSSLVAADTAAIYALVATAFLQPAAAAAAAVPPERESPLSGDCWQQLPSGLIVLRGAGDAGDASAELPAVHLSTGRAHKLLPFSHGKLLVLTLLQAGAAAGSAELDAVRGSLAAPAGELAAHLEAEIKAGKTEAGHVPGCRYAMHDGAQTTVHASPRSKVSAMSHHARALATAVDDSLSWGSLGGEDGKDAGGGGGACAVEEVWVKSSQDVWVVGRQDQLAQRRLLVLREKRLERTMNDSLTAMDALSETLARGV